MTNTFPEEPQPAARERRAYRLVRAVGWSLVALYFVAAIGVLGLRFFLLPRVGEYRAEIARIVSDAVGERVEIGAVDADWFALHPRLELHNVRVLDRHGEVALELPYAAATLAWRSLAYRELQFRSLVLDRPELRIRRDSGGRLFIAGLALRPTDHYDDTGIADWLIDQGEIIIRQARIVWTDERRGAAPLQLDKVSFVLENRRTHHRFALRAEAPGELAAPLDVRGDLVGAAAGPIDGWQGRLYVASPFVDLAAWRQWVDYPFEVNSGRGAVAAWLAFRGRTLTEFSADVALADVSARLAHNLDVLELASVQGRVGSRIQRAQRAGGAQTYEAYGEQLAMVTRSGVALGPSDFRATWQPGDGQRALRGELAVRTVGITALAHVAGHVPLPEALRREIVRIDPRGRLDDVRLSWVGEPQAPVSYRARTRFTGLGMQPWEGVPGFAELAGSVELTEQGGSMVLDAPGATVSAPDLFPDPTLRFDVLTARLGWTRSEPGIALRIDDLVVENEDLAGAISGTYRATRDTAGEVDFTANVVRAAGPKVYRYIPKIGVKLRTWLKEAIFAGTATDGVIRLQGDLGNFPFRDDKGGIFRISANVTGAALRYADAWPEITGIDGGFVIAPPAIHIYGTSGDVLGAQLRAVHGTVPDAFADDERMSVAGEAEGDTRKFLAFIDRSPVKRMISGFTEGWTAAGRGKLTLKLGLPFARPDQVKLAGSYRFTDNRLAPGPEIPELAALNGTVTFTEDSVSAKALRAETHGSQLVFDFMSRGDGTVALHGEGRLDAAQLARDAGFPLAERVQGGAGYSFDMTFRGKHADFVVESDLAGVALDLPAPFGKAATDRWPTQVERVIGRAVDGARRDVLSVTLGTVANARLETRVAAGKTTLERGTVGIGAARAELASEPGVRVAVDLPELDLDALAKLAPRESGGAEAAVTSVALRTGMLVALGRRFHDVTLNARRGGAGWDARAVSQEVVGNLAWRPEGRGALMARLERLELPDAQFASPRAGDTFNALPALDVVADGVYRAGRYIGRLELVAVNEGENWRIQHCEVRAPEGAIVAQGAWRPRDLLPEQTTVSFKVETTDAGKYLARFGYTDAVARGEGTMQGELAWNGPPHAIDYATLNGRVKLGAGKGQFLKAEPGISRLLGLLSLQSLQRRSVGDFGDVLEKGFAFDSIAATAKVSRGVMNTEDFIMVGPSAAITMKGSTDIARETQKLELRVVPEVGGGVAAAAGLALLNPLIGAGTLLAQQLFKNPIGQMIALEYDVSGTWRDPLVRLRTAAASTEPATSSN